MKHTIPFILLSLIACGDPDIVVSGRHPGCGGIDEAGGSEPSYCEEGTYKCQDDIIYFCTENMWQFVNECGEDAYHQGYWLYQDKFFTCVNSSTCGLVNPDTFTPCLTAGDCISGSCLVYIDYDDPNVADEHYCL